MKWSYRLCLFTGVMLLAISVFPDAVAEGAQPVVPTNAQCTGSWACSTAPARVQGCLFTAGRVPQCILTEDGLCDQKKVLGYICQGTTADNLYCQVNYYGCQ